MCVHTSDGPCNLTTKRERVSHQNVSSCDLIRANLELAFNCFALLSLSLSRNANRQANSDLYSVTGIEK